MQKNKRMCSRCVLDTTVPEIKFDDKGACNYCKIHDELEKKYPNDKNGQKKLREIVEKIKRDGKNKKYDCIIGVSGGRDSTYTLYMAKKLGLRPLAVHFDNGWNSEIAVNNIKNITNKLGIDLYTHVADWEEFKDLQISFLKASVPDAEVPTDYAIISVLYKLAAQEGVNYFIVGHSFRTEGTSPIGWTYMDGRYIKNIHKTFGKIKSIKSFPILSATEIAYYTFIKKIREVRILEYMDYNRKEVNALLERQFDWKYYGGHHHESIYTQFFQSYYLIKKFNIDKRKKDYSAMVRSGQMNRKEAIKLINKPYPVDEQIVNYTINKLGLSKAEFEKIMQEQPKSFQDYPNYYNYIQTFKFPIKIGCKLNLFPKILELKYLN
ncbi:N-acetyl sugar amidotransferase [Candidatus Woesearchaeota archaeon]|nr:N-acetyl sugar amidotransferase [Candidatus Woesearchaeota archaeon]